MAESETSQLPRLGFVHIPRSAGTTVTEALAAVYGDLTFPGMTTLDYASYTSEELHQYRLFKGHAYRRDYERLPSDTTLFTILREPCRRIVSFYRYYGSIPVESSEDPVTRQAINLAHRRTLSEFVYSGNPCVIEHVVVGQIRQFLSPEALNGVGYGYHLTKDTENRIIAEFTSEMKRFRLFTTEGLAISLPLFVHELGIPVGQIAPEIENRKNITHEHGEYFYDEELLELRKAISDFSTVELECYELARRMEYDYISAAVRGLEPRSSAPRTDVPASVE